MFEKFKCFSKVFLKIVCVVNCLNLNTYCPLGTYQKIIDKFIFVNIFVRNFLSQQIRRTLKLKYLNKLLTVCSRIILGKLDLSDYLEISSLVFKTNTQCPVRRNLPLAPVKNQSLPVPYDGSVRPE